MQLNAAFHRIAFRNRHVSLEPALDAPPPLRLFLRAAVFIWSSLRPSSSMKRPDSSDNHLDSGVAKPILLFRLIISTGRSSTTASRRRYFVVGSRTMVVFDDVSREKLILYPHQLKWKAGKNHIAQKADYRTVPVDGGEPLRLAIALTGGEK